MAKKGNGFGKLVAFATVAGAVAAGISYFTKYKSFHKELEEDFHDFEDDGNDDISKIDSTMNRNYVSLHADKDEFKVAASDMADAARDAVAAAKNLVKDAAGIVTDTAREAVSAVSDTAKDAFDGEAEEDSTDDGDDETDMEEDGGLEYTASGMEHRTPQKEEAPVKATDQPEPPSKAADSGADVLKDESTTIIEEDVE